LKTILFVTILTIICNSAILPQETNPNIKEKIQNMAKEIVSKMSDKEKAGQTIHIAIPGKGLDKTAIKEIRKINPGGVILFGINLGSKNEILRLTSNLQAEMKKYKLPPLFISTDQEGGRVVRVQKGVTGFPGAMAIGQTENEEYAYNIGFITSYQLNSLGINVVFAPSLDINNNPENPVINTRSFGSDKETVTALGSAYEKGAREGGAMPVIKHFPGHGDTNIDSHLGLPIINKSIDEIMNFELVPFKKAIENGARSVMSAHIIYPQIHKGYPATLSKKIINGILREDLKFDGVVFTDAMEMHAISKNYQKEKRGPLAIQSGADIILLTSWGDTTTEYYKMILRSIKNKEFNEGDRNLLDEALIRQVAAKIEFGLFLQADSYHKIKDPELLAFLNDKKIKADEKYKTFQELNLKEYNRRISIDSIRSLYGEFSPIAKENISEYSIYTKMKLFKRESKMAGLKILSDKGLKEIQNEKIIGKYIFESREKKDLEEIQKIVNNLPGSEIILFHYGSPFLDFPNHSNLKVILSFSPTAGSLIGMFHRVFYSDPKDTIKPVKLILKNQNQIKKN
jgi:beta-N-acetylhexosaminidase